MPMHSRYTTLLQSRNRPCNMESFLSSLPPYVHDFLEKEPPFEVFNVLRELICFAVLYSNDRKHIQRQTESLLEENAQVSRFLQALGHARTWTDSYYSTGIQ